MNSTRKLTVTVIAVALYMLTACDPQRLVNAYFKSLGLNPLAIVRDDIQPGALIVKKGSRAVYSDSIYTYSQTLPPAPADDDLTAVKEFQAVLKEHEAERTVDASMAVNFLKSVLPLNIETDLGLSGKVRIDLINATGHRLKPKAVQDFLRNNSAGLHEFLSQQEAGSEAYVAYETYSADTLRIVAESGTDVSSKVAISSEFKPLSAANASFKYKRTSKDTLLVKGDHPYVFALRASKLVYKNSVYTLQVTNFLSGNVKAVGGDEKYAAPVLDGFAPLGLETAKR